jgi:integrase
MLFLGIQGTIEEKCLKLYQLSKSIDIELLESHIIRFINFQKNRIENREISEGTLHNYVKAIKLFFAMNDTIINWKKISKGIPQERHTSDDRIPTRDEISKLLKHPDRRIIPLVLTMVSSGIRVGSWDYLKWKHVIPILKNGIIVGAQLRVKNTKINNREYITFMTKEAYESLKDWMDFRQLHGEEITGESWLMRDTWQKIDRQHGHRIGLAKYPRKISSVAIRNMIYEAWKVQGIRSKLSDPERKRHEFKSSHGFRKFFETKCQNSKMNHNNIKLLMDHSLAESQNYHRPTTDDLFQDYLNAVESLTINEENRLKVKVNELMEKQDEIGLLKLEQRQEMKQMREDMESKLGQILAKIDVNKLG